jgi:hypothetical protein
MGIEPTSEAWEAFNKTLKAIDLAALSFPQDALSWKLDGNNRWLPHSFRQVSYLGHMPWAHIPGLQQLCGP